MGGGRDTINENNKDLLEETLEELGLDVQTFNQLYHDYKKVCKKLGVEPKCLVRRSPSPPKPIPVEKLKAKYGGTSSKLMKDSVEIVDGPATGGSYNRDKFGLGYSGEIPIDRQAIIKEKRLGGLKKIFVKGQDHDTETCTDGKSPAEQQPVLVGTDANTGKFDAVSDVPQEAAVGDGLGQIINNYQEEDEIAEEETEVEAPC